MSIEGSSVASMYVHAPGFREIDEEDGDPFKPTELDAGEEEDEISSQVMQETHDVQLRNMKERWNLLLTLRREKKNQQRTPAHLMKSTGEGVGDDNDTSAGIYDLSSPPSMEAPLFAGHHGSHASKKKKKTKTGMFKGNMGNARRLSESTGAL